MPYEALILTPDLLKVHPDILPSIARLHASCILIDGTLATFLPPLNPDILSKWWSTRWYECQRGDRSIIIVLANPSDATIDTKPAVTDDPGVNALPSTVCGVVSLSTPPSETGPFRGIVEKLLVSPSHRRLGLGRTLMAKLEAVALSQGRTNIMLDTTVGTVAEEVYPRLGYRRLGVVERYGIHPLSGELVDEVWFWKDLNVHSLIEVKG